MFKGRKVTWAGSISDSIKELYKDPIYLAKQQAHRLSLLDRAIKTKLKQYRYNCKTTKRTWALSDAEAIALFLGPCHYCGFKPTDVKVNGIDRMNGEDYVPCVVVSCCWTCNRNKGSMSYLDFIKWILTVYHNVRNSPQILGMFPVTK